MRICKEKQVVEVMIRFYCKHHERNKKLCSACSELLDYAYNRLERCPYGDKKKACKSCRTHCYKPNMRERMRIVMRYTGPRMMLYHPIMAIRHLMNL